MSPRKILEAVSLALILFGLFSMVQPWLLELFNFSIIFLGLGGGIWITLGYIPRNPGSAKVAKILAGLILIPLIIILISIVVVPELIKLL